MELTPKSQAEIAQSVEQCIRNAKVVGSIPIFGILRKSENIKKTIESEIILHSGGVQK